jgi:hypothetical protein
MNREEFIKETGYAPPPPAVRRRAAQIRVDKKLKRKTPEWIVELAHSQPHATQARSERARHQD